MSPIGKYGPVVQGSTVENYWPTQSYAPVVGFFQLAWNIIWDGMALLGQNELYIWVMHVILRKH